MRLSSLALAALFAAEMSLAVAPSLSSPAQASPAPPQAVSDGARWLLVATGPDGGASSGPLLSAADCLDAADLVPLDRPGARGLCLNPTTGAALVRR